MHLAFVLMIVVYVALDMTKFERAKHKKLVDELTRGIKSYDKKW